MLRGLARGFALALVLCAQDASAKTLEWTAGQLGGGWYGMAGGMANLVMEAYPELEVKVVPGGGKDNPTKLQRGLSQIGMGLGFLAHAAVKGEDPYGEAHTKVRAIGSDFSPSPFHYLRVKDKPLGLKESLATKGLRIGVTKAGSVEELTFQRTLKYYATSYDQIRQGGGKVVHGSYAELVTAFKDGQIDFMFFALGLPGAAVLEIAEGRREAELVSFPGDINEHLFKTYGYGIGTIPAKTYPAAVQNGPLAVPAMDTVILISADVDEVDAYKVTMALLKNTAKFGNIHQSMTAFDPKTGWKNTTVPLHPGAQRAYRELGYMK
ncbi:MAG: TAXI family TRAP transporter solute-binding subunit [Alphaproteobacteria bacterium]|nr:TAXI family TRAP transporter solute-binding subunit [Alphaproteobacteria bacterium]